ncbi:MAG: hypothetical protein LBE81_10970 [Azonexus sp.]|jgi:hypothetical protein|uniref:DUF6600 domain-containing protein n=1 Tax=Azonexus sp. TaxID=1872668 RepID=UPI00281C17CD|nr:DUF6600 domain-containing protein [Azonexus sp.]MDR0777140.1 hypothetical protein [Azonexus sp.]
MTNLYRLIGSLLLAQVLSLSLPLAAQTEPAADPPGRVGRLGHIEGEVTFRPQPDEAPDPATRNWPLSSGAVLETGADGRAEAWIDSTAVRLDEDSQLEFAAIGDHQVLLDLNAGRLGLSIMDAEQATDLRLRLPEGQILFDAAGRYRFDVLADRSELTVFAGHIRIEHDGGSSQLAAGKRATLFADGSLRVDTAGQPDAFDHWVAERENASVANTARQHVSPYMTGYQDLDAHGDWSSHADYGAIWMPRAVASDWAPYRFGRWAWISPWGWTWIDAAPWGFAPFHYGRWVMLGGRWAWAPGKRTVRPVYAPALVGWLGNPGWSVSFGFGTAPAVGWFPLAPREVFVPRYRYSPVYIWRINIIHVRDVKVIEHAARGGPPRFAYRDNPRAATVVPARQLREGRPIGGRDFQPVERRDLEGAPASAGRDWLAPTAGARQPWPGSRQAWPAPQREARDMPRPDVAPVFRRPAAVPTQPQRPMQRPREEQILRPAAPSSNPFGASAPNVRRGDVFSRPATGMPNATPSRALPTPEIRRESREIMRPAPRLSEGQNFRRAEPAAPRPSRGPGAGGDGPRSARGR